MRDEGYRRRFRKDYDQKFGIRVWHRDFFDAVITDCPDASVIGKSFGEVGVDRGGVHPVDVFLDLVLEHGTKLRWFTTISNHRPDVLRRWPRTPTPSWVSRMPVHTYGIWRSTTWGCDCSNMCATRRWPENLS